MSMTTVAPRIAHLPSVTLQQRRELPEVGGVYFVVDEKLVVVYVGQTENLNGRWRSHHRAPQMSTGAYRIHWKQIDDPQERARIEQQCIDYLRPLWNRSEVPVSEQRRLNAYINDVARHLGIPPHDLVYQILAEWAYSRLPEQRR